MLISEIYDSKAIALKVTENVSNEMPYLGKTWFPDDSKSGLDLKWIKGSKGLPVALTPSNFDTLPTLRARGGISLEKTQMAFFREEMDIAEKDIYEIQRANDVNDPYLKDALLSIYNDADTLVEGARVVGEIMRMSLLAPTNGNLQINISAKDVTYAYNFDSSGSWKSSNYTALSGTSLWSATSTATPIADLNAMKKTLKGKGTIAKYVVMNSTTFNYIVSSTEVQSAILAQNPTANVFITEAMVTQVIKNLTGLTVVIYDKQYKNYSGVDTNFYPNGYVSLLPAAKIGKTWYGETPEALEGRTIPGMDVSVIESGITIATKKIYNAPLLKKTVVSEVLLPSAENIDSLGVIKVA